MGNEQHIAILKQGIDAWNDWREKNSNTVPDLRFVDLGQAALSGINLKGAILHGSNLFGADLSMSDLSETDLEYVNLKCADLSHVDLSRSDLHEAELIEATLAGANLTETNLRKARLNKAVISKADLSRADLSEALLFEANFREANLTYANLSRTDLSHVDFSGADLSHANFLETRLYETGFGNADLSNTKNLESCHHIGASMIDHRTLVYSGRLPEIFLRGCGLSDDFINYIPSLFWSKKALEFYSCFISYSHTDKTFARRLYDSLQGHGIRCWLDEKQMLPGDVSYDQIDRGIKLWDKVLLCCSENSLENSWWVDKEIDKALNKEREILKQRGDKVLVLIPLDLDNYMFSDKWKSGKKSIVLERLAADFTGWEKGHLKFESEFEKVAKALRSDKEAREQPPEPKLYTT